ncbi:protein TIFY 11d-like [Phragmites australis]|uniref:protein TIFY 11d-like n=1 Tax=Phragmites australis TaxID=29695 RepID=UPI002D77EB44|nr:protein TIFY 11d-like [Phragmites australis]
MAAVGNSLFAVTFGLLRQQYRREQQQIWDLAGAFEVPPPSVTEEAETDTRTMQLFPTCPGMTQPSQERPEAQVMAPLTISYEGRVLVFGNFPVDKAKELMQLVKSLSTSQASEKGTSAVQEKAGSYRGISGDRHALHEEGITTGVPQSRRGSIGEEGASVHRTERSPSASL